MTLYRCIWMYQRARSYIWHVYYYPDHIYDTYIIIIYYIHICIQMYLRISYKCIWTYQRTRVCHHVFTCENVAEGQHGDSIEHIDIYIESDLKSCVCRVYRCIWIYQKPRVCQHVFECKNVAERMHGDSFQRIDIHMKSRIWHAYRCIWIHQRTRVCQHVLACENIADAIFEVIECHVPEMCDIG